MQTAGMIKSAGRNEQEDNKGDERKDNGKKQQRGRRKGERNIDFKVIRDHERKKDEGRTGFESISQREQRKKEAKGRENVKEARRDKKDLRNEGVKCSREMLERNIDAKQQK